MVVPDLQIREGGGGGGSHPDPEIRGAGLPFGPQFGPFRDPPLVRINIF